ncbi:MAG: VWA domain-containing protein [Acidobacteria bacterium]|nr:VWA domain-containing protein [Acidobacteriota bacterium]
MSLKLILFGPLLAVCIFVPAARAQSGRKVDPPAEPTPAVTKSDEPAYSESIPHSARVRVPTKQDKNLPKKPMAQRVTNALPAVDDPDVVKITTDLITIPVSVFDKNGIYIPGLTKTDFKVFEDGKEQDIAYFGTSDKPFTVALLLDTSPSTAYRIEEIRRAAIAFVDQLKPQDRVIVIEFHWDVKVRTKPTSDREEIYKAINKADFGEGTSLYTAVDEALRKQLGKIEGRKAVVLFTDGVDTTSDKYTYDSTLNYAEESDSLVFPIYYNTYLENRARAGSGGGGLLGRIIFGGGGGMAGQSAEEYALGKKYLEELADVTGGRVFQPEATPGGLTAAFTGIAEELRRQYNIGYVPNDSGKPGQRKSIKVRVDRPNLIVRARDSYIVGASTGSAPTLNTAPTPTPSP